MNRATLFIAGIVLLGGFTSAAHADPFLVTAQTTTGSATSTAVSGSNLPDLVNNLVNAKSDFSNLKNRDYSAEIRYGRINNAILLTKNAANTSATVSIPSIGFSKTFTGSSASNLESQIENYAKKNGADIYGNFIRSINEQSTLGVADGNPLAATAIYANAAYTQFGLNVLPTPGAGPLDQVATPNIRLDFSGGYSHASEGNGYYAGGAFSFGYKFGSSVGLVFTTPFEYRYVAGSAVYELGEEVSLPVVILHSQDTAGFTWMVTPTFVAGGAGSVDLASGGVFLGGGVTSSLSYQIAGFTFTLADHFDYNHGFPITIGDYKFQTNLDQEILKNGLQITRAIGNNLTVDAGITYTHFLERAAVREYWTPTAGLSLRMSPNAGVRVAYAGDFGSKFIDEGGTVAFYLNY